VSFQVDGQTMYKTREACRLAGTNVNTFFRWVRQGKFADVEYRDRNGWRLFTISDIHRLEAKVKKISRLSIKT
jgi:predicted site-specific integrase-resolvase